MNDLPDFSPQGYRAIRELGRNAAGGRVVYLCQTLAESPQQVVIKQFQFAKGSGWAQFKEIEREMQVLKDLDHQGIPRYIGSIQTDDGYSIVQEFKDAQALSIPRSFDPDQIKQIAVAVLEILVYLQARIPVVIHRDIKPENVLVDEELNVFLIDFGFARIGGGEVAMSSVAAGTFGFMAPEQMYNKGLTAATDLYGLGAMLIALLTQTKSTRMDALIDEDGKITFQHLTPKLSLRFMSWLETMVAPRVSDRYPNAESALSALEPIYVVRYPSVEFSQPSLEFRATRLGERITQTITVSNSTADTLLEGNWSIESHPHDPPYALDRNHKWISFSSRQVKGNQVECDITVDTSKLIAQAIGTRSIVLHSNAVPETHSILLEIKTAPLPVQIKKLPTEVIILFLIFTFACGRSISPTAWDRSGSGAIVGFLSAAAVMMFWSFTPEDWLLYPSAVYARFSDRFPAAARRVRQLFIVIKKDLLKITSPLKPVYSMDFTDAIKSNVDDAGIEKRIYAGATIGGFVGCLYGGLAGCIAGATFGGLAGIIRKNANTPESTDGLMVRNYALIGCLISTFVVIFTAGSIYHSDSRYMIVGIIVGAIVSIQAGTIAAIFEIKYARLPHDRKYPQGFIFIILEAIAVFGLNIGASLGQPHISALAMLVCVASLTYLLFYLPSQHLKKIAAYRQREKYLMKL